MSAKQTTNTRRVTALVGRGVLIAAAVTILSAAGLAALILGERIPQSALGPVVFVIITISTGLGTLFAAKPSVGKSAIITGTTGLVYFFLLMASGILFFDGHLKNVGIHLLAILIGAAVGTLLVLRKKGSRRKFKLRSR